jgi:hypothetical protein
MFKDDVSTEMFLYSLGISNVTAAENQIPDEELTSMSAFTDGGRRAAQQASIQEILERTLAVLTLSLSLSLSLSHTHTHTHTPQG